MNKPDMNKLDSKRNYTEHDVEEALEQCVEAAVALGIQKIELVAELLDRYPDPSATQEEEPARPMFNPEAGP